MSVNKRLVKRILEMKEVDQKSRLEGMKDIKNKIYAHFIYLVDAVNNQRIKNIIEKHGYPTSKLIGKKGMNAFWLLVHHQDSDIELQEECLKGCKFNPNDKARLTDRICINDNKKQIYGTQYFKNKKGLFELSPTENTKIVNKRRKEIDLGTLKEYIKEINKSIK